MYINNKYHLRKTPIHECVMRSKIPQLEFNVAFLEFPHNQLEIPAHLFILGSSRCHYRSPLARAVASGLGTGIFAPEPSSFRAAITPRLWSQGHAGPALQTQYAQGLERGAQ